MCWAGGAGQAGGAAQPRAGPRSQTLAQKGPGSVFLPEKKKFIVVVVIGRTIKRVILALVFAQAF